MKRLAILGSTGSIGRQTLDIVRAYPEEFEVFAMSAWSNRDLLLEQAREFHSTLSLLPGAAGAGRPAAGHGARG